MPISTNLTCFKSYDVRGRVPEQLNTEVAYLIGRAYADFLQPDQIVIGRDARLSSEELASALADGVLDGGSVVYDIGLCGSEEIYFATFSQKMDGGIMITRSHNPKGYNGLKLLREDAKPISGDTGLRDLEKIANKGLFSKIKNRGNKKPLDLSLIHI